MFTIESIHHVSLPIANLERAKQLADLERAKQFYQEVLGLQEINRPRFDFPGA
jgi:glyoxylase I family protein